MNLSDKSKPSRLSKYFWAAVVLWSILVTGLFVFDIWRVRYVQHKMVKKEARANFNKDQAFRLWAASHGGVYVPASGKTPPNPYLDHIPERDIKTPTGKTLTLMNPAYMLRQTMDEYENLFGIRGHITSLKYFRPETAPDEWEKHALKEFEIGTHEVSEFTEIDGKLYFRFMSPMTAKERCLKCHGHQGYKIGDVRGGVSVSVPMAPYLAIQRKELSMHVISYGLLWVLGVTGIGLVTRRLKFRIMERDKAEESLRESESGLAEAQRIAHLGNWDLDLGKNELRWSDGMYRIFGLTPQEFEGTYETFLERVHPDDRGYVDVSYKNSVKNHGRYNVVYRIIRPDGKVRYVHERAEDIKNKAGKTIRSIGTAQDITEQKKLEEQLHQSQKMEAIGKLAGGVAHDFNNLLTTIMGYTDIMLMQVDQESPLRSGMEEIKKASNRATTLTSQLLAFSRKQMIQPVVLNINHTIAEMDKMLCRMIGEDIDLATILEPELWKVKFDPGQMDQVLMNLAVNAKDAMPKGGKLTIETANVELDEVYARQHGMKLKPGPFVVFAVSDTGVGIDEKIRFNIFEPFFTTKEKGKGTGLGLSTVYGIVKQGGGYIWVYSEPGQGTTFKIYLPKSEEEEAFVAEAKTQPQNLEGSETILLAEDDDSARKLIRSSLQEFGYWVLEAQDGKEALQLIEHHKGSIHLLLTDVVMPGMSGRELADRLQPLQPKMKVLYMSGYTDNAIFHHGVLESGMQFIQKPFTPKVLISKVREVLDT